MTSEWPEQLSRRALDAVFAGAHGKFRRRSNFSRRVIRSAADGDPTQGITPIRSGFHFHDLRHTHTTWMDVDGIRERMIDYRLGHLTPGVKGRYRHPTPAMVEELLTCLECRWHASLAAHGVSCIDDLSVAA